MCRTPSLARSAVRGNTRISDSPFTIGNSVHPRAVGEAIDIVDVPAPPGDQTPVPSDLVIFMSPVASDIKTGESVSITLSVSGGTGLTAGTLELRLPPGLRLQGLTPGEFITAGGGSIQQLPGENGLLKLTFNRNPAGGTDAGPFATLALEGLITGNAPVVIQSGQFLVGTSPISGRWSNALVTVQ